MRVALSGREGQLGQSFKKIFAQKHHLSKGIELIALSRTDLDITNKKKLEDKLGQYRPDFFINAAAYTQVDSAEDHKEKAFAINADALESIGDVCERLKVIPFHISTDYVFNGEKSTPYVEEDITDPINVYGQSKLVGEKKLLEACPSAIILRTSWLFSEFGQNFLKTMLKLSSTKEELSIIDDQIGGPTYAPHLAQALLKLIHSYTKEDKGQLYHFSGQPFVSWYEFAHSIFEDAKVPISLEKVNSDFFSTKAKRPMSSRLDCSKIQERLDLENNWREGVRESISQNPKGL
jgi:dTDP-4-dehydrorhamnose reductase